MNTKKLAVLIAAMGLMTGAARADWGHGLRHETKDAHVNSNQQGGWWVDSEADPKPCAASCSSKCAAKPADVDSDHDGVVDEKDNCEGTAAGTKVDAKGCPKSAKAVPDKDWTLAGVQFETGSDQLKSSSQSALGEAADILKTHTRVSVEIQGHTDNIGGPAANQTLSDRRAAAVRTYLIGKGVAEKRLEARGYGESKPIASNDTEAGRAQNRRIDFKVLGR